MSGQPIQHVTALLFRQKHNIEKSIIGSSWCAGLNRSAVGRWSQRAIVAIDLSDWTNGHSIGWSS